MWRDRARHHGQAHGEDAMTARLLIVEDEDTLCHSLQRVLLREGYEVDRAASAEDAIDLLRLRPYDLIITDIILPGISGIELLTKYKKSNPGQKVMVITAYASLLTAVEAIKAGACDFLMKPLMHDEMRQAVQKALNRQAG
jgi:DNA-binding NtrC family response regulator